MTARPTHLAAFRGARVSAVAVLGAALSLLAGCAVGPDYARPELDIPASYRFASATPAGEPAGTGVAATPPIDIHWWSQFGDPVLDDLIARSLAGNRDVLIAAARVEEYYGRIMTVRGTLFPQIGAEIGGGRQRLSNSAAAAVPAGNPFNQVQADVFASWEIDLFGRIRRQTEAARAEWAATDQARRSTEISVVAAVASGYITLRDLDNRVLIAGDTAASRQDALKLFQDRFEGGVISEVELAQARSEYASTLVSLALFQQQVAQQENLLSVLIGENPQEIPRGKPIGELLSPSIPANLPSSLIAQRPDLLQAEQQLVAANAQIGAARAQYYPTISLTGMLGVASTALSGLWSGSAKIWSYSGLVSLPIFTGGSIAGDVKQAEARQVQALEGYRQAVQTGFREVADALVGVQRTREQLSAKDEQVNALSRYALLARDRFEGGYTSYLEVLDSERALFSAQLDQSGLRNNQFGQIVQLYKSLGAGWPVSGPTPATPTLAGDASTEPSR